MALFLRRILSFLLIDQKHATVIYEDNHGALFIAKSGKPSGRTKHMDVRYFALHDWIKQDLLFLESIHTSNNVADAFTKALGKITFDKHRATMLGLFRPY